MRLKRSLMKTLATTLAVAMILVAFSSTQLDASLFSRIRDSVRNNPVRSAVAGIAAVGGAILAAPYIASAVGFASGSVAGIAGGAVAAVGGAGAGLAGIGATIWGGITAAGGFVTGALGAVGGAIGSLFSGVAGFVGGIIGSPLFIPALCLIGVGVAGYFLWRRYSRQRQTIGSGSGLPSVVPGSSSVIPTGDVAVVPNATGPSTGTGGEIPVTGSASAPSASEVPVTEGVPAPAPTAGATTELRAAHAEYIKAYNNYINMVTNIGGSENPDEELRSNMLRSDTQSALNEYREAYNRYITLLRQSNSK